MTVRIAEESSFRSKFITENQPCDMVKVTLEMPIKAWRNLRVELHGELGEKISDDQEMPRDAE